MDAERDRSPKLRRALPSIQSNHDSVASTSSAISIAAPNFYSSKMSNTPPALPTRPKSIGSTHTNYIPPYSLPPSYDSSEKSPFREPELVSDDPISETGLIARLSTDERPVWSTEQTPWESANVWNASGSSQDNYDSAWAGVDSTSGYGSFASKKVDIDGRDQEEEKAWWDVSAKPSRPGPGMLPPMMVETLHNTEHSLFSVSATPPTPFKSADPPRRQSLETTAPSSSSSSSTSPPQPQSQQTSPTAEEVNMAVPHPNAYYCRKHNGWVLMMWKSSSLLPPLANSFQQSTHKPLPDQNRRKRTGSCVGAREQPFGQVNKTHHFHHYEEAVDSLKLNPAFKNSEWEKVEKAKSRRRKLKVFDASELDAPELDANGMDVTDDEDSDNDNEGELLDLYVCCQCSVYCICSRVIPGVVPIKLVEEFTRDKQQHPSVGKTPEMTVLSGWETVVKILENKLWKGENRTIPVRSKSFQQKIGWSPAVRQIFEAMSFVIKPVDQASVDTSADDIVLHPPPVDISTPVGRKNRAKLLRAWLEVNAWISDYQARFATNLKGYIPQKLSVKLVNAREMYQTGLGSHPDQIPRGLLPHSLMSHQSISSAWAVLGMTETSYSPELLSFAYMAQCRCDPGSTVDYFTHFYNIVKAMTDLGEPAPPDLQSLVMEERSRGRFTHEDVQKSALTLGFGKDGPLRVEFEDDVPEEFIAEAWKDTMRRAWRDSRGDSSQQRDANDAFRILAEARGSKSLQKMWEDGGTLMMNPERAYSTLEVPELTDDGMLLTVFALRVQEQPEQGDRMREALSIIGELRNSDRIRQFLKTGADPGEVIVPVRQDLPRGLNQLGNTCYLNSLLQYFYTIKELREAVAPLANVDEKSLDDDKVTDDDLKRHRVGGRLVTRKEILRSKRFINQLASLFWDLEHCENGAVTPSLQLAKLALTTSRDEDEDEAERGGTDSSNDTDATLVEDAPSRSQTDKRMVSPSQSTTSVLGKRLRDNIRQQSAMDVDSPVSDPKESGKVSAPSSPRSISPIPEDLRSINLGSPAADKDGDVEMVESRSESKKGAEKRVHPPARKNSESVMMFGRQHDVAECMDNCMFQIETALLKFGDINNDQGEKTSVVKRLFYGKLRQRLNAIPENEKSRPSIHEKEDLFSHLPINVNEYGGDIYDGLSHYFDDVVEFQGKKTRMEVSVTDLPPMLQIQLQRVQFNRETLQPYKSQAYVKFGETLYMDRFLEGVDAQKKAQSKSIQTELDACRERIRVLTQSKYAPFESAIAGTFNFLSKEATDLSEVDEDLIAELNDEQGRIKAEVEELRARATKLKDEIEEIWQDESSAEYELTSVFIHRGSSPSWGHYFFYARHLPEQPDSWFKYNDSEVTPISKADVLADTTGSTANPYLLVFAKKGSEAVQTVNRFDPSKLEEIEQ